MSSMQTVSGAAIAHGLTDIALGCRVNLKESLDSDAILATFVRATAGSETNKTDTYDATHSTERISFLAVRLFPLHYPV